MSKSRRKNREHSVAGRSTAAPPRSDAHSHAAPPVVGFVSLGCAKNLVDSERMLAQIAESGALIGDESVADTVVVNTCGFLASSRQEALEIIGELALRRRQGDLRRLVVVGCLVQRDGNNLLDAVPEIDSLVGVHNRDDVPAAVWGNRTAFPPQARATGPNALLKSNGTTAGPRLKRSGPRNGLYLGDYHPQPWSDQGRLRLTPRHYAYVRMSEGCDQKCTFCTIPSIRGPMHSKTPAELRAECRELIADGVRELILIGQDTTSYGDDLAVGDGSYAGTGLAGLLRALDAACDGARWIRLMYVYPSVFTDEMIAAIAGCARVVKYIDLPLQHINDRVLRAMGRRVTRPQTEALLTKIRGQIPGVAIRTTFIVGFPGETEAEFQELLDFIRAFGFDAAGAFKYSNEPETPAARLPGHLDDAVKAERYARLMLAQQEVALAAAKRRIGQTFEAVIDGHADQGPGLVARHSGQAPEVDAVCRLPAGGGAVGAFVPVSVVGTAGYDLVVQPVGRRLPVL